MTKNTNQPRVYMASPTMHEEELQFIQQAFDTNWIAPLGPNVDAFEREMEAYTGVGHSLALSSGTSALHLAVKLLDIHEEDVVICQSFTFAATCNPVAYEKGKLVFVDSEPDTWNMSPVALRKALEKYPQAKAVIYVHLYGTPAKVDEILSICKEYQVPVIEDAAESLGAAYKGVQTGNFGTIGAFSFNGNKIITTSGGGMLVSQNKAYVDKARFLATQAKEPKPYYEHLVLGYNYRMSNIVAGVGRGQLIHLPEHIAIKRKIYETYKDKLKNLPVTMNPYDAKKSEPNFWLSCMTISEESSVKPMDIIKALEEENIESRPVWNPMHKQPVYADCDFISHYEDADRISVSEDIFNRGLCLPSDIKNDEETMEKILKIIKKILII